MLIYILGDLIIFLFMLLMSLLSAALIDIELLPIEEVIFGGLKIWLLFNIMFLLLVALAYVFIL